MKSKVKHLSSQTQTQSKDNKNNERNEAICGCVCDTNNICSHVSTLKSCI